MGTCARAEQREQAKEAIQKKTMNFIRESVLQCNPGGHWDIPGNSCDDIPQVCSSGWYWLKTPSNETVKVYCDLERKCGCENNDTQKAWMRVAYLVMTDPK